MGRVSSKTAIVTGAAQGNGLAAAQALADEGAQVVLTDLLEDKGRVAAAAIKESGADALFVKHDVVREDDWRRVIEATVETFGSLEILVNNAGVSMDAPVDETTFEDWRWVTGVNLDGVFLGTKHAVIAMKQSGGGSIVNISSMWGSVGYPRFTAYCASKGGVTNFTKAPRSIVQLITSASTRSVRDSS